MCGIHAVIASRDTPALSREVEEKLHARGPDHVGTTRVEFGDASVTLTSTVLSLRGDHIARQPLVDPKSGSSLCWNGEVWRIDGLLVTGSDTEAVFQLLVKASSHRAADLSEEDPVLAALRTIEGPFAFVFVDRPAQRLYYGRDRLGRRSLLVQTGPSITLSSVAESTSEGWREVEADGCYSLSLDRSDPGAVFEPQRHAWLEGDDLPIDLLNVAFENPRIAAQHQDLSTDDLFELCPDRITARKTFAELQAACPGRKWRLVAVNVPYSQTRAHRAEIVHLMYPHNTEMDLSIANALYFAARGQGQGCLAMESPSTPYTTTARVLLSGLGADELFGGYVRHNTAFQRNGYPGLTEELKLDVSRLGKRNLGRDDRVMAHCGKEVRFPFLDERLVKWAIELPAWEKCDFSTPAGEGHPDAEKRVLRLLAQAVGLPSVATEKKRAIQFGTRTAKMESGRVKGTTSITL
ncbi:asparagine synthase-like protein [Emericellopsis cladophorae]|uniref:Asparagine synthase-like protein n=1 Tax=Emericellopsis cladophorae TaxID=2686198 RepID=A0A9P9Y8J1_9HYPO|nr:asparagine synthase-like protein [Emericellopsis cladophorae]KAI6785578.1 asparagine synthase-like protein [Emericellopsis cladophorae]